ncbi:MAG: hypothetical protein M1815_000539 [Lichina confinis]|nr:MAG: hypothetical protein M1815_000539 [Lichina confinis]
MSSTASLPAHCSPSSPFLAQLSAHLHICLPTPLALVSSTLGLLSIAAWLFAQLPQIFANYAVGSTSGLSIFFLIEWCLGDSTNLLGAIFTGQASWQVVVAAYYVFVDLVLVWQYAWYTHIKPRRRLRRRRRSSTVAGPSDSDDGAAAAAAAVAAAEPTASAPRLVLPPPAGVRDLLGEDFQAHSLRTIHGPAPREKGSLPGGASSAMMPTRSMAASPRSMTPLAMPKSLLYLSLVCALAMAHPSSGPPQPMRSGLPPRSSSPSASPSLAQDAALLTAGRVLSWSSTLLYLGSRLPQLYKNYVRQSTSGLSAKLFIAAFFGNLFYSTSLLTNPCAWYDMPPYGGGGWAGEEGNDRVEWLGLAIPFWLGAAGVLSLDAAIGVQFLMYREEIEKEIVRDENGRWRRVTGWMRGWAPIARSSGPAAADDPAEAQPLLSHHRRRSTGAVYGNV